ncbi:unnamed protein product [Gordionus sp. m RMFG-2023]
MRCSPEGVYLKNSNISLLAANKQMYQGAIIHLEHPISAWAVSLDTIYVITEYFNSHWHPIDLKDTLISDKNVRRGHPYTLENGEISLTKLLMSRSFLPSKTVIEKKVLKLDKKGF